ncbi:MAG: neutral zinc metallopeptidase [Pirellula sp.]|jgi:predicted metalloprotease
MRWEGREESQNVEDRRGSAMPVAGLAGGGVMFLILSIVISMLLGANPRQLLEQAGQQMPSKQTQGPLTPENDKDANLKKFVSVVLKDNEDVWNQLFREQLGARYEEPKLVVFTGAVRTACGDASAAVGPFYCPGDKNVYLDFDFFRVMERDLGAKGEFAMAYVIAHEVGHHVQNLLGLSSKVQRMQMQSSKVEANALSVRLELQADYLAGVWAHHAQASKQILEKGDIGDAINTAKRIGDDVLQKKATGRVREEAFTHGSAEQRAYWFTQGLKSGDLEGMMKLFELPPEQLDPKTMR